MDFAADPADQKLQRKRLPTGWADVLKAFHRNDTIDLLHKNGREPTVEEIAAALDAKAY